jgi:hypothetical protein
VGSGRCDRFHADLSAYVDGTLPHRRCEQVSHHIADCETCRDEVASISSVCSTLSACARSSAPSSLTSKLESIAGEHAEAPLYMAPGRGELPSTRRRRQRLVTQGGAALLVAAMSVMVLAVLIAPDPRRLDDPVRAAREQFSRATAAVSVNEALGAVLLAHERGADLGAPISYEPLTGGSIDVVISETRAADWLRRAADADLSLTGVQRVWISDGSGLYRSAEVRTTKLEGYGAELEVLDARGDRFSSSFLPEATPGKVEASKRWSFTESFWSERVAGREAIRLTATDKHGLVASWWLDLETDLVLWSERYDGTGEVSLAFGYTELSFDEPTFDTDTSLTQLISLQPASASEQDGWCVGLEHCPQSVAGLPLVAYASSEQRDGSSMTLVYSDGFETAVVGWTDGVLVGGETSRTHREPGMPTVMAWQSGPAVVSVTSTGTTDLLAEVAEALPAEEPHAESLLDRTVAGLGRLVGVS